MCLLITQKTTSARLSDEWLEDFYDYNSDGVGVMYANNGNLVIEKVLPKNAHQFIAFYREHIEGRECAFHLRMRTHGDIDLNNCHPYEVLNQDEHGLDLWLMHNGVLSTGNQKDATKSDTWHYIRDYLRPMLEDNPDYAFTKSFADIVGSHIGASNKFVLMDNEGRMTVVNQGSGVFWAGLWLSNTYAWSASKNTSKTPVKNRKTIAKHAKELPSKSRYGYGSGYGYGYGSGYGNRTAIGYLDEYEDGEWYEGIQNNDYDIGSMLDELENNGVLQPDSVSFTDCQDFVNDFGLDAFYEVSNMLLDGNINEEWYVKTMQSNKAALDAFPFLKQYKGYDYAK
jgi:hypothetical protein